MGTQRIELDIVNLSAAELEAALLNVPKGHVLNFYDPTYPSISDPGAYVKIRRVGQQYELFRGNHGWSSGWKPQTADLILAYLLTVQASYG